MQKSVRKLATRFNMEIQEIYSSGEKARCCGFGGHPQSVTRELSPLIADKRIKESDLEYITYCTNCRDVFASRGKECRHILDLLFTDNASRRIPPSLSDRRRNRLTIKKYFTGEEKSLVEKKDQDEFLNLKLDISPKLTAKMNSLLILEEELKEVIYTCEKNEFKLVNTEHGYFTAYKKIGLITYWVVYYAQNDGYILKDTYSHRMTIEA